MSEFTWQVIEDGGIAYWRVITRECIIDLAPRPHYCDRGSWLAYADCKGYPVNKNPIDNQDGFPRYYFDLERAKLEIEAFLSKRKYTPA